MSSWSTPKPDVHVWSDASPWGKGAVNSHGDYFQRSWTETESCQHKLIGDKSCKGRDLRVSRPT